MRRKCHAQQSYAAMPLMDCRRGPQPHDLDFLWGVLLPFVVMTKAPASEGSEGPGRVRLDKWLWAARFFKTRALAAEAIDRGHVEVNDDRVKRSRVVALGDRVRVKRPPFEHVVVVRAVSDHRGSATIAAELFEETEQSRSAREALASQMKAIGPPIFRDRGRPGKKDRREIDRWRGRDP